MVLNLEAIDIDQLYRPQDKPSGFCYWPVIQPQNKPSSFYYCQNGRFFGFFQCFAEQLSSACSLIPNLTKFEILKKALSRHKLTFLLHSCLGCRRFNYLPSKQKQKQSLYFIQQTPISKLNAKTLRFWNNSKQLNQNVVVAKSSCFIVTILNFKKSYWFWSKTIMTCNIVSFL